MGGGGGGAWERGGGGGGGVHRAHAHGGNPSGKGRPKVGDLRGVSHDLGLVLIRLECLAAASFDRHVSLLYDSLSLSLCFSWGLGEGKGGSVGGSGGVGRAK